MSLVGGYCRVVSAFRGAFCCALPDIFSLVPDEARRGADGPTGASTAVHGRAGHSLTVPHPGSQYCLRAAQAQSGRSKKLAGAALQLCFQCVQPAVARFGGDFGDPESGDGRGRRGRLGRDRGRGLSLRRVGMRRAPVHRLWVLMAWRRTRAAPARARRVAGSSGALSACSCPRPGSGCRGCSGNRTGLAADAPVRSELGVLQHTTSSTSAP